jgi:hypothetical protein
MKPRSTIQGQSFVFRDKLFYELVVVLAIAALIALYHAVRDLHPAIISSAVIA